MAHHALSAVMVDFVHPTAPSLIGSVETSTDTVAPCLLGRMAATLGIDAPDRVLPPLWHWMLFQTWVPRARIGADGHPQRGGFLPALPELPRRMWAGSRLTYAGDLQAGDDVTRTSTITAITEREGRSGRLVFVTVRHEIARGGAVVITEEQDLVYRDAASSPAPSAPAGPIPDGVVVKPDEVMLFRYSALTGNGHRIHYDAPYATRAEQYPGLVVHGPLIATLLCTLLQSRPDTLIIRAQKPAFAGQELHLVRQPHLLQAFNNRGEPCMSVKAD
jgi:3-methylfumaryl-CoA hydratase